MGHPCVFFDRDGIVNRSPGPGYVERLEDFHLQPDFFRAMQVVQDKGYVSILITNQRGVARGCLTRETLDRIHEWMRSELAGRGLDFLDIYVCTDLDDDHPWRKPNPGMILAAAEDHDLDLSRSWMVGDQAGDVTAGRRAGCRTILVADRQGDIPADFHVPAIALLPDFLSETLPPVKPAAAN